jgi:hypothetical protein
MTEPSTPSACGVTGALDMDEDLRDSRIGCPNTPSPPLSKASTPTPTRTPTTPLGVEECATRRTLSPVMVECALAKMRLEEWPCKTVVTIGDVDEARMELILAHSAPIAAAAASAQTRVALAFLGSEQVRAAALRLVPRLVMLADRPTHHLAHNAEVFLLAGAGEVAWMRLANRTGTRELCACDDPDVGEVLLRPTPLAGAMGLAAFAPDWNAHNAQLVRLPADADDAGVRSVCMLVKLAALLRLTMGAGSLAHSFALAHPSVARHAGV